MKKTLSLILPPAAALLPFRWWQSAWGERLFFPFYHLVSDHAPAHVRHLYPVRSVRQFCDDLDFFLKYFQPVDLPTLATIVFEKKTVTKPVFHLTFDDGLRECHEVIAPILLQKGIPATFFLNPDFIDNQALMFRYKAGLLKNSHNTFPVDPLDISYAQRGLLDEWAREIGLDFSEWLAINRPYLTLQEIKSMQAKGFTFGAHSLDHPLYAGIEPEERLRQTLKSLEIIENQVGMTISAFAFPFTDAGMELDFFQQIREFWRSPLLTFGTAGAKKDDAPKHLQRFAMERTTLGARKVVSAELALSVLRKTVGRQTVQRK